ncbi:unnamed protein product [Caenorhabditis sp. 36 PRJEB53466]|nr:unnamed protein product [Caenorhabditis sp. 36 PRJEB53466]
MDSKTNEALLEAYTQEMAARAIKDIEKYLEENPLAGTELEKEQLLEKVLHEEQQAEYKRNIAENLLEEHEQLIKKAVKMENELKMVESIKAERAKLLQMRAAEQEEVHGKYRSMDAMIRMKRETEELRAMCNTEK